MAANAEDVVSPAGVRVLARLAVVALGTLALLSRTTGAEALVVTLLVGTVGLTSPACRPIANGWFAMLVRLVAFGGASLVADAPVAPATSMGIAVAIAAAVAEESFFRGFSHDVLSRELGNVTAVIITAVLFALVHVPLYGWGVLPVDVTAGVVFGWQRCVTRSWSIPAATHLVANILVLSS